MNNRKNRFATLALATLLLGALAACNGDPTPSAHDARNIEATRLAVTKMGEPFAVDGCQVQAHRVTVTGSLPNFTLVTAQCPTARVTATTQSCGKNCTSEAIKLEHEPVAANEDVAARARELRAKVDALAQELQQLEAQAKR